jgi:polyisoprenoid-binding protein YceI
MTDSFKGETAPAPTVASMDQATNAPAALAGVPTGTWLIDPAHSVVGFSVRYLMGRVRGRFGEFSGQFTVADDPLESSASAEIQLASVHTGNEQRDNHLRTADFLDVATHPLMTFASTGLSPAGDSWFLDGTLTIRGTGRPVRFEVDLLGFDPTGVQGEPRIGFEGRASIRRGDFGVSFGLADGGKIVIGDQVDIQLDIEAVLDGAG